MAEQHTGPLRPDPDPYDPDIDLRNPRAWAVGAAALLLISGFAYLAWLNEQPHAASEDQIVAVQAEIVEYLRSRGHPELARVHVREATIFNPDDFGSTGGPTGITARVVAPSVHPEPGMWYTYTYHYKQGYQITFVRTEPGDREPRYER